jgi:hypothetical protein
MDFGVEKKISNFVESQFPQFYLEEGEKFVEFVKAYYEWMETENQITTQSRSLFDYRDIDNTLTKFLEYFQRKYLYGIPFNVIIDKRLLLKHILDVYRSKGSIQCYRLLFKLLYNQDVNVYLPGEDVLRVSDGTWVQPKYLEVTDNGNIGSLVGQQIYGVASKTIGIVESYDTQPVNGSINHCLYISNLSPQGGQFIQGEKVILYSDVQYNTDPAVYSIIVNKAPTILGSLNTLEILNGGQGFKVGDLLKIVRKDLDTNAIITNGIDGELRVIGTGRGQGALTFFIDNSGTGYRKDANVFLYNEASDLSGHDARFKLGSLTYARSVQYNTDIIANYDSIQLDATSYGFANINVNVAATINSGLTFVSNTFGSIGTLTDVLPGNNYIAAPYIFVRTDLDSKPLTGTLVYDTTSNTIAGTSTQFDRYFQANDVIYLQANGTLATTGEYQVIKEVTSATSIELYGPPKSNSKADAFHSIATPLFPANFAPYELIMKTKDNSVASKNGLVTAAPSNGNDIVTAVTAYNSGKSYLDGEIVTCYLFNSLNEPLIINGGTGYSNNEQLLFSGGGPSSQAQGYIQTNGSGAITNTVLTFSGSGYQTPPYVTVVTRNGQNAVFQATITPANTYNTYSAVTGKIIKSGIGVAPGYFSTTKGFLNSDKYIHDNRYYQDYSYQIETGLVLNKYKDILYNTFHIAGTALFGKFFEIIVEESPNSIGFEQSVISLSTYASVYMDNDTITVDNDTITVDRQ